MEIPVIFLDGDLKSQIVFGVPNVAAYRRLKPPEVYGLCDCEACADEGVVPYLVDDEYEEYHIRFLGGRIRVGAKDRSLVDNLDKAAFYVAELAYRNWQGSYYAESERSTRKYHEKNVEAYKAGLAKQEAS